MALANTRSGPEGYAAQNSRAGTVSDSPISPDWFTEMSKVANELENSVGERHTSCVFAPPTNEYFALAFALSAVGRSAKKAEQAPEPGTRVATVLSDNSGGRFVDKDYRLSDRENTKISLDWVAIESGSEPPMVELPMGLERLGKMPFGDGIESHLKNENNFPLERDREMAKRKERWGFFELCKAPVVVLASRNHQAAERLNELTAQDFGWTPNQLATAASAGTSPEDWYRSPLLVLSPRALKSRAWVSHARASVVVALGMAPWLSKSRWLWPAVPHVLFLDPRSENPGDITEFREWWPGRDIGWSESKFARFKGVPGIPAKVFDEKVKSVSADEIEDLG